MALVWLVSIFLIYSQSGQLLSNKRHPEWLTLASALKTFWRMWVTILAAIQRPCLMNKVSLQAGAPVSVSTRLFRIISWRTSSLILEQSKCKTSEDRMLHPQIQSSQEYSRKASWSQQQRSWTGVPIWIFPFNIQLIIWNNINILFPKPHNIITHLGRVRISTIAVESLVKGSILHLGNGTYSVIQHIGGTSMVTGNPWEEMSRHQVAVIGGKAHGESGKGYSGIVGI